MKKIIALLIALSPSPAIAAPVPMLIHQKVEKVCPIVGLSGDFNQPTKLRIDFADAATKEQKQAAQDVLNVMLPTSPTVQQPDLDGFFVECANSLAISKDGLMQLSLFLKIQDSAKRMSAVSDFINSRLVSEKSKIKELAAKHNITVDP